MIFDFYANKTTTLQKRLIEEWLREEANQELYYQWKLEWELQFPPYVPPLEEPLQQFIQYMEASPLSLNPAEAVVNDLPEPARGVNRWYWLVACSVLVVGLTTWLMRNQIIYKTYQTSAGEQQAIYLADGSTVTLHSRSSLRVPRWSFGRKSREVTLEGEANFSVTHTIDHLPFIVKTARQLDVVVLGTEFTLSARQNTAKVVLKKGKVQLRYLENKVPKQVVMKPGDLVTLDQRNHADVKTASEADAYDFQKSRRFVFDEMTLADVAVLLQRSYDLEITIKGTELPRRVLMGSFKANNIDELLQTLSELLDINVVREGRTVQMAEKEAN
ncbi:hypothetical protein GCM10023187_56090 [Nibrella viscosa]|uniref:FecR family protein n=2 Tax=Nibrella viscosa TaxID=1084524 RepID=A0ABP8L277_9BACT